MSIIVIGPSLLPSALTGAIVVLLPLLALAPARPGGPVLVVGSPWGGAGGAVAVISQADGLVLRDTSVAWIAIGQSDRNDFQPRLHRAGAWITLDATWAFGCLGPTKS